MAFRIEIATQGGTEQQIPPHATVIKFGAPTASYVPIAHTGDDMANVVLSRDRFTCLLLDRLLADRDRSEVDSEAERHGHVYSPVVGDDSRE